MSNVIYYNNQKPTNPLNDEYFLGAFGNAVTQLASGLTPGGSVILDLGIGTFFAGSTQITSESTSLIIQRLDDSRIRVGDALYPADVVFDASLSTILTSVVLTGLGITAPASVAAITVAAGVGLAYTAFFDPAGEVLLDVLAGTVDVQFELKDASGAVLSTAIYRDGLDEPYYNQAVADFLGISGEEGVTSEGASTGEFAIPQNGMTIEVKSLSTFDPPVSETYVIYTNENSDGTVTSDVAANAINLFFNGQKAAFLSAGADGKTNADIFAEKTLSREDENGQVIEEYYSWLFAREDMLGLTELGITDPFFIPSANGSGIFEAFDVQYIWAARDGVFFASNDASSGLYLGDDFDTIPTGEHAGAGDDWMFGGGGVDRLSGDEGKDRVYGGAGDDFLYGDSEYFGLEGDLYHGGSYLELVDTDGIDTLDYSAIGFSLTLSLGEKNGSTQFDNTSAYHLNSSGNLIGDVDQIISIERFILTNRDDTAFVTEDFNYNVDHLDAGQGNDVLDFSASGAAVTVDVFNGSAYTNGAQEIKFENFEEFIGSAYFDTFWGRAESASYDGLDGTDVLSYSYLDHSRIYVDLNTGLVEKISAMGPVTDSVKNIEIFEGTGGGDFFRSGEGLTGVIFDGGAQPLNRRDILDFTPYTQGVSVDLFAGTVVDSEGGTITVNDFEQVVGSSQADIITGGDGADWLFGRLGDDVLSGGIGDDYLIGGGQADILEGGNGNDVYYFNDASDISTITDAGGIDDRLYLGGDYIFSEDIIVRNGTTTITTLLGIANFDDQIERIEFSDRANFKIDNLSRVAPLAASLPQFIGADIYDENNPNSYNDILNGTEADEFFDGGVGDDQIYASEGNDLIIDESGQNLIHGGTGNDWIIGSGTLYGDDGSDHLRGENSVLYGGAGEDFLYGSGVLNGGSGNDYFAGSGVLVAGIGIDVVAATVGIGTEIWLQTGSLATTRVDIADNGSLVLSLDGREGNNKVRCCPR